MPSQAIASFAVDASIAVRDAFEGLPKGDSDTLVLVYMSMSKDSNGKVDAAFRPGYIATVFPLSFVSSEWLTARLPDGREFRFLPRTQWGVGGAFTVDLADTSYPTFSVTRD